LEVFLSRTHYQTLGITKDAEDIVIRAAYRALAQKYHPDRWEGDKADATAKMAQINEAYRVLSDPKTRTEYDNTLDESDEIDDNEDVEVPLETTQQAVWDKALKYFPDLTRIERSLSKTSSRLAKEYKILLTEKKLFNDREQIALFMEKNFLKRYFGSNEKIISFARELIHRGHRNAAKELNQTMDLLGSSVNPDTVIRKIKEDFLGQGSTEDPVKASARSLLRMPTVNAAKEFLERIGWKVRDKSTFFGPNRYEVAKGSISHDFEDVDSFISFSLSEATAFGT
jgi:curved DNA-binding protein CbpA